MKTFTKKDISEQKVVFNVFVITLVKKSKKSKNSLKNIINIKIQKFISTQNSIRKAPVENIDGIRNHLLAGTVYS